MSTLNLEQILRSLTRMMNLSEAGVVEKFASLPGAKQLHYANDRTPIVFVPGKREDRVLLVAHYDTVFGDADLDIYRNGYILFSNKDKVGIGADNRAGCCLLWALRSLGHSLLLLPDEEIGCRGSNCVANHYPDILKNHSYMLQFDRKGSYDMAHYGYKNSKFTEYMQSKFPGYSVVNGTSTDIRVLMPACNTPGFNLSIGFNREHTANEYIDIFSYIRTATYAKRALKEKTIPSFSGFDAEPRALYDLRSNQGNWESRYSKPKNTKGKNNKTTSAFADRKSKITSWVKPSSPKKEDGEDIKLVDHNEVDGYTCFSRLSVTSNNGVKSVCIETYGSDSSKPIRTYLDSRDHRRSMFKLAAKSPVSLALKKDGSLGIEYLPCHHCKKNIHRSLRLPLSDGTVYCCVCSRPMYEPTENMKKMFVEYIEDLLSTHEMDKRYQDKIDDKVKKLGEAIE